MNCPICNKDLLEGQDLQMSGLAVVHTLCKEEAAFEEMVEFTREDLKKLFPLFPDDILSNLLLETDMCHVYQDMQGRIPHLYKDTNAILYIEYGDCFYYEYMNKKQHQDIVTSENIVDFLLRPRETSDISLKLEIPYRDGSTGPSRIVIIRTNSVKDYKPIVEIKGVQLYDEGHKTTSHEYKGIKCEG